MSPPPASAGLPAAPEQPPAPAQLSRECPLCGAPLHADQEWCLRCGAAATTRLAAPPKWRSLALALALVIVLALGVIAAALVKLLG